MDVSEMVKGINKISKENERLSIIQKEYVKNAEDLKQLANKLFEIAKRIDPVVGTKSGRKPRKEMSEIVSSLLQSMNNGTQITVELIEKTYPELVKHQIYSTFSKLKNMPGVKFVKDGIHSRLYK